MPFYIFKKKSSGEVKEVFFHMNDVKEYRGENGKQNDWERQWTIPEMAIDSSFANVDPYDSKSFVKKTSKGGDTIDSLWSRSQELHEKRGGAGKDEIKEAYYTDYANKRSGQKHDDVKKREVADKLKRVGIKITPD